MAIPASITGLFLALFLIFFKVNRTKWAMGFMFTCFFFSFVGTLLIYGLETQSPILGIMHGIAIFILVPLLLFGTYILIALLLLNARVVLKRERRSLANCLTLILAVAMLLNIIARALVHPSNFPRGIQIVIMAINFAILYYEFHLSQYLLSAFFCNLSRPHKNQNYIIVLGCGLNEDKVTPLLAKRIDRAINFYRKQSETADPPKLVFSGGQGADELCSEAEAMAEYAFANGIPKSNMLLESKSVSTAQNMLYSKEIMDVDAGGKAYHCIYATSSYHLLRAGIFAHRAGLKINGIGAKTRLYFLPNAILREYIAYLQMYWKRNAVLGILVFIFGIVVGVLNSL